MTSATPVNASATVVARLETSEQTAHSIAELVADRFAKENVAVSLSDSGGGRCQVAIHFGVAPDRAEVRAAIAAAGGRKAAAAVQFARLQATDWVRDSLAGLAPVAAGRFIVHGAHDRSRIPVNRIAIEIEAALAFGTGHHGTTRGCLFALDRMCKSLKRAGRPQRILDLGTGTGVLAIAAARALHRRVLATDSDAAAVGIARANARLNRVDASVAVVQANGVTSQSLRERAPFDLVLANILLGPLQRIAAPLRRLTAPGGRIVLSGLLPSQANAVIAVYRPFALERRIDLDGWTTLVLARPATRQCGPPLAGSINDPIK
jgi:ribosomal protein L11 methyltransferase